MPPSTRLFTGRGRLLTPEPFSGESPWAVQVTDAAITWVGARRDAPASDDELDLGEALVTPGLVDAHTHPIFAGERADEAAARLAGQAYSGGGILRTVSATRAATDAELEDLAVRRLRAQLSAGTTTVEAKSGYGLSTQEELRHLRIIRVAAERSGARVVATFLGAHARPDDDPAYVDRIVDQMLPQVAAGELARFCDVFCDRGFFSVDEAERILRAAGGHGLGLRLHAEQLSRSGAAELGVRLGAASVDHLEQLDADGVRALAASRTVATLLPGPALVMRDRLPPARELLDAGAAVALASDANAGTFGAWGAMPMVIGLGATLLRMTVAEALTAATRGGASALGLQGRRGVIGPGADADLVAWDAEHEGAFALHLGNVRPATVVLAGSILPA